MNEKRTKKAYEKKITIRLMAEDVDYIQDVAAKFQTSQQNAIRMLLYLSKFDVNNMKENINIFILK